MSEKPRYRYDWKMGWWVNKSDDGTVEIVTVRFPVTAWYIHGSVAPRPMISLSNGAYGGGGGGCMYSH